MQGENLNLWCRWADGTGGLPLALSCSDESYRDRKFIFLLPHPEAIQVR